MEEKIKRIRLILMIVFSLATVAYLVLCNSLADAAKPAKKGFVPPKSQHAGKVNCAGCHGKAAPQLDSTVENPRCLECHGPIEKLVNKSEPKDFPNRNPHKSHLGDITCTVCHKEHGTSTVYCLDCHRNFKLKIPGDET